MADYLHRLPADDPFWQHANKTEEDLFWERVENILRENENKMQEIARKRRIARKLFKRGSSN